MRRTGKGEERERETKEKTTASQVEIIASQHELSLLRAIWKIMADILAIVQTTLQSPASTAEWMQTDSALWLAINYFICA